MWCTPKMLKCISRCICTFSWCDLYIMQPVITTCSVAANNRAGDDQEALLHKESQAYFFSFFMITLATALQIQVPEFFCRLQSLLALLYQSSPSLRGALQLTVIAVA